MDHRPEVKVPYSDTVSGEVRYEYHAAIIMLMNELNPLLYLQVVIDILQTSNITSKVAILTDILRLHDIDGFKYTIGGFLTYIEDTKFAEIMIQTVSDVGDDETIKKVKNEINELDYSELLDNIATLLYKNDDVKLQAFVYRLLSNSVTVNESEFENLNSDQIRNILIKIIPQYTNYDLLTHTIKVLVNSITASGLKRTISNVIQHLNPEDINIESLPYVYDKHTDILYILLSYIKFNSMLDESWDIELSDFLSISIKHNNIHASYIIFDKWVEQNVSENRYNLTSYIFTSKHYSMEILRHITDLYQLEYFKIVYNLTLYDPDQSMLFAISRLETIFGKQNPSVYEACIEQCESNRREFNYNNYILHDELTRRLSLVDSNWAPVPSWIKKQPYDNVMTHNQLLEYLNIKELELVNFEVNIPDDETIINMVIESTQDLDIYDVNNTAIKATLRDALNTMDKQDKIHYISTFIDIVDEKGKKDILDERIRIVGPAAPHLVYNDRTDDDVDIHINLKDPCNQHGGHPMLMCYHNSSIEEDCEDDPNFQEKLLNGNYKDLEWFYGTCNKCYKQIRKKEYSVRIPDLTGGWRGVYCSFKCAGDDISPDDEYSITVLKETETTLNQVGIYERSWNHDVKGRKTIIIKIEDLHMLKPTPPRKTVSNAPLQQLPRS